MRELIPMDLIVDFLSRGIGFITLLKDADKIPRFQLAENSDVIRKVFFPRLGKARRKTLNISIILCHKGDVLSN